MGKHIQQLIGSMSVAEKVGQLFVLAFAGHDKSYAKRLVRDFHIGGFYLTDDNAASPQQATALTSELQYQASLRACDAPLLLAVDQEGAWGILTGYLDVGPGNLALGKADDTDLTRDMYQLMASQVSELGYNCILGPCADVNANPDNPIIGQRSFGEQPVAVAGQVVAAVEGIRQGGTVSCAKHFPGHGDTAEDSHQTLPVVDKPADVLKETDLKPFQAAIDKGVELIMTSHICFPKIDPEWPATLSSTILTDLLQRQMGFNGVIITDSMNMWAMRRRYDPVDAAVMSLQAGAHLIMLSEEHYENQHTDYQAIQQQTIQGVIDAVQQGKLSEALVDERLTRVLAMRYQKLQTLNPQAPAERLDSLPFVAASNAIRTVRDNGTVAKLKDGFYYLPLAASANYEKLVNARGIGPNDPRAAGVALLEFVQAQNAKVELLTEQQRDEFISHPHRHWNDKPIVAVWEDYPLPGEDFDSAQKNRLEQLLMHYGPQVVLVCMGPDYPVPQLENLENCLCSYSSRWVSAKAMAKYLVQ